MTIPDIYYLYALLAATALALAAAVLAIAGFSRRCRRLEQFWSSPTGAALADRSSEQERRQLLVGLRLERRITDLEKKIDRLATPDRKTAVQSSRDLPIDNAIRMARRGASVDDLTRSCGLNIGEARLMQRLHGKRIAAAPNEEHSHVQR